TLRRAFSNGPALTPMFDQSMPSRTIPAVLALTLWQPTQYCLVRVAAATAPWGPGAWAKSDGTPRAHKINAVLRMPLFPSRNACNIIQRLRVHLQAAVWHFPTRWI